MSQLDPQDPQRVSYVHRAPTCYESVLLKKSTLTL